MTAKPPLAALRERIRALEGAGPAALGSSLSLGLAAIDGALPQGGLGLGRVHEITGAGAGSGQAGTGGAGAVTGFAVALLARLARRRPGPVLWCGRRLELGEAGLRDAGLDPAGLVFVRPGRRDDALWAIEEGLRCPALAAVVGETGAAVDLSTSRRLQLAAEAGGALGLMLATGDAAADGEKPGIAANALATRWRVAALPAGPVAEGVGIGRARWRVELWRCRGGGGGMWDVEWNHETGDFAMAAALADRPYPARPPRLARAG
jgi:protein ImuA